MKIKSLTHPIIFLIPLGALCLLLQGCAALAPIGIGLASGAAATAGGLLASDANTLIVDANQAAMNRLTAAASSKHPVPLLPSAPTSTVPTSAVPVTAVPSVTPAATP